MTRCSLMLCLVLAPVLPGAEHFLIQPADRQAAARHGLRITGTARNGMLVVAGPANTGLAWVRRLTAGEKISALLWEEEARNYVVEFHGDVDGSQARRQVERAGLILMEHPDLLPTQVLVTGAWEKVAELAGLDEVSYVFPASEDLVQGNRVVGCAGAVVQDGDAAEYVKVGRGWPASGPDGVRLQYVIAGRTPMAAAEAEIVRALAEWSKYARLSFTAGDDAGERRTIAIRFLRGSHGDAYPFDGPGKTLAHTFYPAPPNPEPQAGDLHLDEDENWGVGSGVDVFSVVLHEAGHALGLGHSDRPGTVMYPYYRLNTGLHSDDIAGIRDLYGSREETPQTPPPSAPEPPRPGFTLQVTEPAAAALHTSAASIRLRGAVQNASGAISVSWQSDRGPQGRATGGSLWSVASVPLSPGENRITVTATDAAGNFASQPLLVTRSADEPLTDNVSPSVRFTSPAFSIVSTALSSIVLKGTATDNVRVSSVSWTNSAGGSGAAAGSNAWSAEIPLKVGNNAVIVRAADPAGNVGWRSLTVVRK